MTNEDTQRLVSVLDAMEEGIYIVSQDYTVEFMNKAMVDEFGYGIGKKCFEVVNQGNEVCSWCGSDDVFNKGETNRSELQFPGTDKTYDLIELPLRNTDGSISKLAIYRDITQRKQREERLWASEADFKRLFEHVGCGVYFSSKEGKFLDANQALLDMLGYDSKEEFLEIDITKDLYLRPEDRRKFQDMIERDGQVIDYMVDFKRRDGHRVPVMLNAHVRHDHDGNIIGYEGIMVDQTQREQMEEDYRRLFENMGTGVFISSKEGKFLNANQALLDMLGYDSKEEFLTIDIVKDLYKQPEDRQRFRDIMSKDGRVVDFEVDFKRKDGSTIPILLTGQARYDQEGNIVGYEGLNVDQTQRKQMEKDLKEAHDFLNMVIQSSPNAIITTDLNGNILIWNQGAETILGYPASDVVGKMNIKTIYVDGMAQKVMKMMRSPRHGGPGKLVSYPMTYIRKDGGVVEGNLSASIIYDTAGNEVASVGIFVDLKERLEMEQKLRQIQEQLLNSEKLAAMGRLTSQIAHELNNPLYGIMNTLELLKSEISPSSKRRKVLEMALSETVRLSDLLRKMLSFSKPDQEDRQVVDVNTIIDEILLLHEKQLRENDIRITYDFDDNLGKVHASINQLRQVFLNMVGNARDAMPEGGTLDVKTSSSNHTIKIEITDTGIGIKEENINKIFDAFFTTKDSVKGVGLGLSVCYGFIIDHGGDITVKSKPEEGTTFTITLPEHIDVSMETESSS